MKFICEQKTDFELDEWVGFVEKFALLFNRTVESGVQIAKGTGIDLVSEASELKIRGRFINTLNGEAIYFNGYERDKGQPCFIPQHIPQGQEGGHEYEFDGEPYQWLFVASCILAYAISNGRFVLDFSDESLEECRLIAREVAQLCSIEFNLPGMNEMFTHVDFKPLDLSALAGVSLFSQA